MIDNYIKLQGLKVEFPEIGLRCMVEKCHKTRVNRFSKIHKYFEFLVAKATLQITNVCTKSVRKQNPSSSFNLHFANFMLFSLFLKVSFI